MGGLIQDWYLGNGKIETEKELIAFLSDISQRHTHGMRRLLGWDDCLSEEVYEHRLSEIRTAEINGNCYLISKVAKDLLEPLCVSSRPVEINALDEDDALVGIAEERHCVLEVRFPEWFCVDLDAGYIFQEEGRRLSAFQYFEGLALRTVEEAVLTRLFAGKKKVDVQNFSALSERFEDSRKLLAWHTYLGASMFLDEHTYCVFDLTKEKGIQKQFQRFHRENVCLVKPEEFLERFY